MRNAVSYLASVILGYAAEAVDPTEGEAIITGRTNAFDLVLIHATGDDPSAMNSVELVKNKSDASVVVVLRDDGVDIGAQAFLNGADDVVDWPCSLHELGVRLQIRLGRSAAQASRKLEGFNWETEAYIAEQANLTTAEAQVMRVLFNHDGEVVSRDELSLAVDSRPWRYGDRKFDVHVAKIRKKLTETFGSRVLVSTIRSVGYCLSTNGSNLFNRTHSEG